MTTMDRVKKVVGNTLDVDVCRIADDDRLIDLGAHSLNMVEFPFELSLEFGYRGITDWFKEDCGEITIRQITERIHEHLRLP